MRRSDVALWTCVWTAAPRSLEGYEPSPLANNNNSNSNATNAPSSLTTTNTLDHFFEELLTWDVYASLVRESHKDFAFSDANDGSEEGEVEQVAPIPSQFRSYDHYFSVWKPLALEEVQAQTLNNVATDAPNAIPVTATGFGVTFLTKTCKLRVDVNKQVATRHVQQQLDGLFANDLVLLSPSRSYFQDANAAMKAANSSSNNATATSSAPPFASSSSNDALASATPGTPPFGMLGIVSTQKGSREGLTMQVLSSHWGMVERPDELYLYKLSNLITSVREFRALCDCRDYKLMPLLLTGTHKIGSMRLDSLGAEYVRWLNRTFNDSQLEAITAAATSDGFTLIKGPPGTGKTTTLKGLLNSLHLREYSRYYNAVLDVASRPDHETNKAWAAIGNEKPHILVCCCCLLYARARVCDRD